MFLTNGNDIQAFMFVESFGIASQAKLTPNQMYMLTNVPPVLRNTVAPGTEQVSSGLNGILTPENAGSCILQFRKSIMAERWNVRKPFNMFTEMRF